MPLLTYWPYLLLVPALGLGAVLGWSLHAAYQRRDGSPLPMAVRSRHNSTEARHQDLVGKELELVQLDEQLRIANLNVTKSRGQLEDLRREHSDLLLAISECESSINTAQKTLKNHPQGSQSSGLSGEHHRALIDLDESGEELEILQQLSKNLMARIASVEQEIQQQEGKLSLLRQTNQLRRSEISEAEALITQREDELKQLVRKRKQRETDLAFARQQLNDLNEELQRLIHNTPRDDLFYDVNGAPIASQRRQENRPYNHPQLPDGRG